MEISLWRHYFPAQQMGLGKIGSMAQAIIRLDAGKIAPGSYEVRAVSGTVKDGKCSGKGTWKGK